MPQLNPKLTTDVIIAAVERAWFGTDNPGFCIACGHEQEGCEPDARNIECEVCHLELVFGAEEILFMME